MPFTDLNGRECVTQREIDALEARLRPAVLNKTSLGERVRASQEYKSRNGDMRLNCDFSDVDFKTLLTTAGTPGYVPANDRTGVISPFPPRRVYVSDLIGQGHTNKQVVKYVRETLEVLTAAVVAEDGQKPEASFTFTPISSVVAKIAAWVPATEEQIADVDEFVTLINTRLMEQCLIAEETQILTGAGGTAMTGLYNAVGVQTQARGADTMADAIYKAGSKCRFTGIAEPNAVVIHPTDYDSERLRKDSMGNYIWGPPTLPPPPYIWEMQAVITSAATVGQPLVGDFRYAHLSRRGEGSFAVSNAHGSYFTSDILSLRAELRSSLEVYRPQAFCYVTA